MRWVGRLLHVGAAAWLLAGASGCVPGLRPPPGGHDAGADATTTGVDAGAGTGSNTDAGTSTDAGTDPGCM
jgi:hypothetical protein